MARRDYSGLDSTANSSDRRNRRENTFKKEIFVDLPENVKFFNLKEGKQLVDIIPYEISSDKNPLLADPSSELKKGSITYYLRISVHKSIGVNDNTVICPKGTFGKSCPICEEKKKLWDLGKGEDAKGLNSSDRGIYWIKDVLNEDPEYLVFEQSTFLFEAEILKASKAQGDGTPVPFAHPRRGKSIGWFTEKAKYNKSTYLKPGGFYFKDREVQPGDEAIDAVFDLSDYLNVLSYEELKDLFFNVDNDEEEESKEKEDKEDIKSKSKLNSKEYMKQIEKEQEEDEDSLDSSDRPPIKFEKSVKKETPKETKKSPTKSELECPSGYKIGADFDSKSECDSCSIWNECSESFKSIKMGK